MATEDCYLYKYCLFSNSLSCFHLESQHQICIVSTTVWPCLADSLVMGVMLTRVKQYLERLRHHFLLASTCFYGNLSNHREIFSRFALSSRLLPEYQASFQDVTIYTVVRIRSTKDLNVPSRNRKYVSIMSCIMDVVTQHLQNQLHFQTGS